MPSCCFCFGFAIVKAPTRSQHGDLEKAKNPPPQSRLGHLVDNHGDLVGGASADHRNERTIVVAPQFEDVRHAPADSSTPCVSIPAGPFLKSNQDLEVGSNITIPATKVHDSSDPSVSHLPSLTYQDRGFRNPDSSTVLRPTSAPPVYQAEVTEIQTSQTAPTLRTDDNLREAIRLLASETQQHTLSTTNASKDNVEAALERLTDLAAVRSLHGWENWINKLREGVEVISPVVEAALDGLDQFKLGSLIWAGFELLLKYSQEWQGNGSMTHLKVANPACHAFRAIIQYTAEICNLLRSAWKTIGHGLTSTIEEAKSALRDNFLSSDFEMIAAQFKRWHEFEDKTRFEALVSRLNTVNYKQDLDRRRKVQHGETCTWSRENETINRWLDSSTIRLTPQFLWVTGGPGMGKSILAASLIEELIEHRSCHDLVQCLAVF
ncbi:predicted protein [Postia placenta Mad-698-R]|nr:predicted protein [Postia placenta Mad-698-R]